MAHILSAVSERRLRPIYEQLDNGSNKKALHEAEKVLKKQKDLTAAKVLKAIALHRMGKEDDAFQLSQEIVALEPTDDNSLQGLCLYYKEIHKTELISSLYEVAVKHCPNHEEYLSHLFMSYVRHEKFQQMQRVAMILYKHHPKNPYLFWGIMAIVLQAETATDRKLAKNMYLPLAEKMIEKHIEKGKIEAEAEVRLYLVVLELLGKHEKALEVLDGALGEKLITEPNDHVSDTIKARERAKQWDKVNVEYKRLLKQSPDVWNYALGYLDSLFHLLDQNEKDASDENDKSNNSSIDRPDRTLSQAVDFIMELVNAENDIVEGTLRRGPYLLRLELFKRLKFSKDYTQDKITRLGSSMQLILEYALDFSSKPCCFYDLVPYYCLIAPIDIDKFLADLYDQQATFTYSEMNGECSNSLKRQINRKKEAEIQRHIFTLQATRYLGKHETLWNEEKLTLATDYVKRHKNGLRYSSDRPMTDGRLVDSYCLFAVRLLIDVYLDTEDTALLWRCASVLECGLKHSQCNYEMKFMLIRVYCRLGLFTPCAALYESLEVKHVQQDTLGYTVCRHVAALGHFHIASQYFQMAKNFYLSNNKESGECLIACFRNGTFNKVFELVEYRKRVKNSLNAVLSRTEHALMDLFVQGDIDQPVSKLLSLVATTKINYEELTDNRDFSIITDINPENKRLTQDIIDASFVEEKNWLMFRKILLHCLHLLLSRATAKSSQQNGHSIEGGGFSELDYYISELEKLTDKPPEDVPTYPFHGPHISRIHLCFEAKFPQTMLLLFKFCRVMCNVQNSEGQEADDYSHYLTTVISNISDFLKTCCNGILVEPKSDECCQEEDIENGTILSEDIPDALLCIRPSVVERLVMCSEIFSLCVLLLTNMHSLVADVKTDLQRRKRKKKGKQTHDSQNDNKHTLPEWVRIYEESIPKVKSLGARISSAIDHLKLDADTMLLDLAKCRLSSKDKQHSMSDGMSKTHHIGSSLNSEMLGAGDKLSTEREETNPAMESLETSRMTRTILPPTIPEERIVDNKLMADDANPVDMQESALDLSTTKAEKIENADENEENSKQFSETSQNADGLMSFDEEIDPLKEFDLDEDALPSTSAVYSSPPGEEVMNAGFDKIVKTTSESFVTTCKQLSIMVEGRMKCLKDLKM